MTTQSDIDADKADADARAARKAKAATREPLESAEAERAKLLTETLTAICQEGGMSRLQSRHYATDEGHKYELDANDNVLHRKSGMPAAEHLEKVRAKGGERAEYWGNQVAKNDDGRPLVDPNLMHKVFIEGNKTAVAALVKQIGIISADDLARKFGWSSIVDIKNRPVSITEFDAVMKGGANTKSGDVKGTPKGKADDTTPNFFLAQNWNKHQQAQLWKRDKVLAGKLATLAGFGSLDAAIVALKPVK